MKKIKKILNQETLIFNYYKKHKNRSIKHPESVDYATKEWKKRTGKIFRDPDRSIRKLYEQGKLIKISKGCYQYDSRTRLKKYNKGFTSSQKRQIFKKDKYKCVICGLGKKEGEEIHADHIKPLSKGGLSRIVNGQTLCSQHNMLKKNLSQTETGKKMFISILKLAKDKKVKKIEVFCEEILKVYQKHNINGHIKWKK